MTLAHAIPRSDLVPQHLELREEILAAIDAVLRSGRFTLAEQVSAFESEFASAVGRRHGVGVNSGTDALVLALRCMNVGPGDHVVTTPFTAIPTMSAIRMVGARPVFADIDPRTFLLDPDSVAHAITAQTKAVIPVHLFGLAVDVRRLRQVLGPGIPILEDCAQCHGATIHGKQAGTLGDLAAFSFYPTKNLGACGDGGMVLTDRADWNDRLRRLRMFGMVNKDETAEDGCNSRLDELQAAILRVKLRHLPEMNRKRRALADSYAGELAGSGLVPQHIPAECQSAFHVYAALAEHSRDRLLDHMERSGIQVNVYYPRPLYRQASYIQQFGPHASLPVVEEVCQRVLALPMYAEMPSHVPSVVAASVRKFLGGAEP